MQRSDRKTEARRRLPADVVQYPDAGLRPPARNLDEAPSLHRVVYEHFFEHPNRR